MEEFLNFFYEHIVSISGALLASALGAHLAWYNGFRTRRANACAAFRSAINAALEGLYPLPVAWPENTFAINNILRARFPAIQLAVNNFIPFVPWYRKQAFVRAWHSYRNAYDGDKSAQCYHHYMAFDDNPDPKEIFKSNVDHLVSFANET